MDNFELLAHRAVTSLSDAVRAATRGDIKDAWCSYGSALAYESLYDYELSQRPGFDLKTDSLYQLNKIYRALCDCWSDLLPGLQ